MMGVGRVLVWGLTVLACVACDSKKEEKVSADAKAVPIGSPTAGEKFFITCKSCHGDAGQGNATMHAPALVNLDGSYLFRQLMNFRKGLRGYLPNDTLGMQMAAIAKTALTDSTMVGDVAAYIETLPDVEITSDTKGDFKKGERTYQSICGSCHGPSGKGNEAMFAPRLNGLQDWYLKGQIADFKKLIRGAHDNDQYGGQMVLMADLLADQQAVDDVVAYLNGATKSGAK